MAADMPSVTFGFTKLVVDDLEASMAFYEEVFGLTGGRLITGNLAGRPIRETVYAPIGGMAAPILLTFEDDQPQGKGDIIVGVVTNDLDALTGRVVAAGGSVIEPPHITEAAGAALNIAIVADKEGHMIEILERR